MVSGRRGMAAGAETVNRAWREGMESMIGGYGAQWRQMTELLGGFWNLGALDGDGARETVGRVSEATRRLFESQTALAAEWLRVPFWATGAASPMDLQAAYARLFDAQRELFGAYLDATLGWQRALSGATERAAETAREAVDAQTRTAKAVANDAREAQQAAVDATRAAANDAVEAARAAPEAARETAARATERADRREQERAEAAQRESAARAAERAERRERERTEAAEREAREERERQRRARERERDRADRERFEQAAREIKGNVNRDGEKVYHLPGQASYERTQAEELFATEEEAQAAGYRRSRTRGGGTIKGVVGRDGERIYHMPGRASYDRIEEPDMLFETEEQARANGFRAAMR